MAEDLGEKTEEPTSKRLQDARERGQVAKSTDLSSAIVLGGATLVMFLFAPDLLRGSEALMRHTLSVEVLGRGITGGDVRPDVTVTASEVARMLAPVMGLMVVVAFVGTVVQVGLHLSSKALEPRLDRLSPIGGLKRLFSKRSLVKAGLDLLKFALIGSAVGAMVHYELFKVIALPGLTLKAAVVEAAWMLLEVAVVALLVLLVLGLIDFTYQKWQHKEDLKMTKHEVKEERKSAEGDADVKGRRFKMARDIASQRVGADVPKADVVVTNPTHYAVALKYDEEVMDAPRVIVKGADFLALRIRQVAASHGVAIVERPALARALYAQVEVGWEVPAAHFEAVAEVLAYVYRLEGRAAS